MRNELNHIESIEQYLAGGMNALELKAFEARMAVDPTLKAEVDLQKKLVERLQLNAFKSDMMASHAGLAGTHGGASWFRIVLNSLLGLVLFMASAVVTAVLLGNAPESQVVSPTEQVIVEQAIEEPVLEYVDTMTVQEPAPVNVAHHSVYEGNRSDYENEPTNKVVRSDLARNKNVQENLKKTFTIATVDAANGGTIETTDSKSLLHFQGGSFVTEAGKPVTGPVEIRYREFRNPAEMAFSKIPMTYSEDGLDYNFNSAGMIEVLGFQNGEELKLKPGAAFTMDYKVTQPLDSCFFFAFDDSSQTWVKKHPILFDNTNSVYSEEVVDKNEKDKMVRAGGLRATFISNRRDGDERQQIKGVNIQLYESITGIKEGYYPVFAAREMMDGDQLNEIRPGDYTALIQCEGFDSLIIERMTIYEGKLSELTIYFSPNSYYIDSRKSMKRYKKDKKNGIKVMEPSAYMLKDSVENLQGRMIPATTGKRTNGAVTGYYGSGVSQDKTLTEYDTLRTNVLAMYPYGRMIAGNSMVAGLRCEGFGVYNCDQIQRVKNQVLVTPKFVDFNGLLIGGISILTMIDLKINASFSFAPFQFKFGRNSETVLLLMTVDKLYAMPAKEFKAMNINGSGDYTFQMTDITSSVQSTSDLKTYLGL